MKQKYNLCIVVTHLQTSRLVEQNLRIVRRYNQFAILNLCKINCFKA